jgi:predicted ArsR family transcriptional regulator
VSENVQIGREAVRQRLEKLEEEGMVSIERANDVSIYRLTEAGGSELRAELREAFS